MLHKGIRELHNVVDIGGQGVDNRLPLPGGTVFHVPFGIPLSSFSVKVSRFFRILFPVGKSPTIYYYLHYLLREPCLLYVIAK